MPEHLFGRTGMSLRLTIDFLKEFCRRGHYREEDFYQLERVASDLKGCCKDRECFEAIVYDTYADIVITLGEGVDYLQEKYTRAEDVLKQWMLENLTGELFMQEYTRIQKRIMSHTKMGVGHMHFWGSEEKYPLEQIPVILQDFSSIRINCTKDFCLRPSKSVLYRLDLNKSRNLNSQRGIPCDTCTRNHEGEECVCRMYN